MANPFVHVELTTHDLPKAKQFYSALFGWQLQDMPMGDGKSYTTISVGDGTGGGMMTAPDPGIPPHWLPYVAVDDIVASTKRAKELKIDIEAIMLSNQAKVVGAAATAPKAASVLSWIKTNVSHVGTNPTGDGTDARVDGTPRAFTEAMLKTVMASVYTNSSEDLDVLMVGASNKAVASGFAGGAQKTYDVSDRKLVTTIDVYVGDSMGSLAA